MNPLYEIIFIDDEKFIGGTLTETKWMEIPDKKIKKFIYYVPNTRQIISEENFRRVYHYVEVCSDLSGDKKGITQLEYSYLIFEKEYEYEGYKINLKTKKIETILLTKDNEMIKNLNPIGWKKGGN
jgi:hypothetical protein